ncbi:MAG: glucosamine-6-phosphate deaminase [Thermomicrobiales bacterium]|nr:glucosamine-6-phosphate deaminase [Thermomicrobiales bacterium]
MIETRDYVLTIVPNASAMSERGADIFAEVVSANPGAVVAGPTGSTPLGMFERLVAQARAGQLDVSRLRLFCLDEYLGVTADDPNSLTGWLFRVFIDPAGIPHANVHTVPATDPDPIAAASRYEHDLIAAGGLDLAILGLGPNGHIAFNEPGSTADSRTRPLNLTEQSVAQAAAYWKPGVIALNQAMTLGVATLLEARRLVLIVAGEAKAEMLRRTLEDPMSPETPASWLRLAADRLEVVADAAAAAALTNR